MNREETKAEKSARKDYDTAEKEFESYPDVFADIINALVYKGKQIVLPENLRSAEMETRYRDQVRELRRQWEDIGKYEDVGGAARGLYLLANQSAVDWRMILRKHGYVGGYYRSQYKCHTKDVCPVMELVLYWGQRHWDAPLNTRKFYQKRRGMPETRLPDEAWDYMDDVKIHVFEMRHLPRDVIERFTSDMRIVLEYLSDAPKSAYMGRKVRHPEAFLDLMAVLSGDDRYRWLVEELRRGGELQAAKEGGEWTMCKLIDEYWEGGKQEGIQQGIRQGIQEGIQQGIQAFVNACKNMNVSFELTMQQLREQYHLGEQEARNNMKLYW